jgi:hypothetical protein
MTFVDYLEESKLLAVQLKNTLNEAKVFEKKLFLEIMSLAINRMVPNYEMAKQVFSEIEKKYGNG